MPSISHEGLLELFRRRPALAAELLGDALPIPTRSHASVVDSTLTEAVPIARAADLVLTFSDRPAAAPTLAVVVEVQLRKDPSKRDAWWGYLVAVRLRYRCAAVLVVVTPSSSVAAWAAKPIPLGHPGTTLTPLVIGPANVPIVGDARTAIADPELAVLSAVVHGKSDAAEDIARAAFAGFRSLDDERAAVYTDVVLHSLRASARAILEDLMATGSYEFKSAFAKKYIAVGRKEGKAEERALSILAVLDARGLVTPDDVRAQILACTSLPRLEAWLVRAATATTIAEVLDL